MKHELEFEFFARNPTELDKNKQGMEICVIRGASQNHQHEQALIFRSRACRETGSRSSKISEQKHNIPWVWYEQLLLGIILEKIASVVMKAVEKFLEKHGGRVVRHRDGYCY